jgi:hypothetical protein
VAISVSVVEPEAGGPGMIAALSLKECGWERIVMECGRVGHVEQNAAS